MFDWIAWRKGLGTAQVQKRCSNRLGLIISSIPGFSFLRLCYYKVLHALNLIRRETPHPRSEWHLVKHDFNRRYTSQVLKDMLLDHGPSAYLCLIGRPSVKITEELFT